MEKIKPQIFAIKFWKRDILTCVLRTIDQKIISTFIISWNLQGKNCAALEMNVAFFPLYCVSKYYWMFSLREAMSSNAFQNKSIALPVAHALKVAGVCKIHSRLCPRELRGVGEGNIFGLTLQCFFFIRWPTQWLIVGWDTLLKRSKWLLELRSIALFLAKYPPFNRPLWKCLTDLSLTF